MTLEEKVAAASFAQRAMKTSEPSIAEFLIDLAKKLDPTIKAEELKAQWLDQWLDQNKDRNGEPSQ